MCDHGWQLAGSYSLGRARGRPLPGGQKAPLQLGNGGLKSVIHYRGFAFEKALIPCVGGRAAWFCEVIT